MMAELEAATCSRSSISNVCCLTSIHWFITENVLFVQDGTPEFPDCPAPIVVTVPAELPRFQIFYAVCAESRIKGAGIAQSVRRLGYGTYGRGIGFDFQQMQEIPTFSTVSKHVLGPTHFPI